MMVVLTKGDSMLPRVNLVRGDKDDYLLFSTSDYITQSILQNGNWDDDLLKVSAAIYEGLNSPLVLDIGANLGSFSVPVGRDLQKSGGKIVAFEPQRIVYYQLCGNIFINRLDNVTALQMAVGDSSSEMQIPQTNYEKSINTGAFSLNKKYRKNHGIESAMLESTDLVWCTRLDDQAFDRPPCMVKIDVEGYELPVLKGATRFLEVNHYPFLLFEAWSFDWYKAQKKALIRFVESLGYVVSHIRGDEFLATHVSSLSRIEINVKNDKVVSAKRVLK
jgi:FkbM family methyltransferase